MLICASICVFVYICAPLYLFIFSFIGVEYLSGLTEQDKFSSLRRSKTTDGKDRVKM